MINSAACASRWKVCAWRAGSQRSSRVSAPPMQRVANQFADSARMAPPEALLLWSESRRTREHRARPSGRTKLQPVGAQCEPAIEERGNVAACTSTCDAGSKRMALMMDGRSPPKRGSPAAGCPVAHQQQLVRGQSCDVQFRAAERSSLHRSGDRRPEGGLELFVDRWESENRQPPARDRLASGRAAVAHCAV